MMEKKRFNIALLPSYPDQALPYLKKKFMQFKDLFDSFRVWGGCILVESSSPMKIAQSLMSLSGIEVITVGRIVRGFDRLAKLVGREATNIIPHGKSYRVKVIRHSSESFEEDEEESMQLTGIIMDEMKGVGSMPRQSNADVLISILSDGRDYLFPVLTYQGIGGLPAGINGKVVLLVSGGAGSVVAGIEIARAGFIPFPMLVLDFVNEADFRNAIISSCFLSELSLEKNIDMTIVVTGQKKSGETGNMHEIIRKEAELEAEKSKAEYICTGIHICPELKKLLDTYSESSVGVLNPVLGWDRNRLLYSLPEELSRRYKWNKATRATGSAISRAGKRIMFKVQLKDLGHYNEVIDQALKVLMTSPRHARSVGQNSTV